MMGEQFIKLPRSVLESPGLALLSINGHRLLNFIMREHLRHGGKCNAFLQAPRRQLVEFGIGSHYISAAIEEVERAGLILCEHGTGRRPSFYGLAWLTPGEPSIVSAVSTQNECQSELTRPVASADQHSQRPKSSGAKQHSPSRVSIPGGKLGSELEGVSLGGVTQRAGRSAGSRRTEAPRARQPHSGKANASAAP
jgi:hypothetical protein